MDLGDYYVIISLAENHLTFAVHEFTAKILVKNSFKTELDSKVKDFG